MKFCIALMALIAISVTAFTQTIPKNPNVTDAAGLRQGKWTLLFDSDWKPITDYNKAVYYRVIAYADDKPTGIVRDYYPSGKIQWEGELAQDRPSEINHGPSTWYTEKGNKEVKRVFDNGKIVEEVYYNLDGSVAVENWVKINSRSSAAYRDGNYMEAISLGEKAKAQAEKQYGRQSKDFSISLNNLAFKYKDLGLYDKAEPLYQEALKIREKLVGKKHKDYAIVLYNMGALYASKGNYDKAETYYLEAKDTYKAVLGTENNEYARAINNMGMLYRNLGQYAKAEAYYLEAIDIRKRVLGEEDEEYGVSLNNLAVLYDVMGQYKKAEPLYLASIKIDEKIYGKDHPEFATSIDNLGSLYESMGQYKKADSLYQKALLINVKSGGRNTFAYATTLGHLGTLNATLGQYDKALQCYTEQRKIFEKTLGKSNAEYPLVLNNLASLYESMGQLQKAESTYIEVETLTLKTLGNQHPNYALVLNNLGSLYFTMGLYEKAEAYHIQSKNLREKIYGKNHLAYATSLGNLANLYQYMGFYDKAELLYTEAKELLEKGVDDQHYCTVLFNNMAILYSMQGLHKKAEEIYLLNLDYEARTLGKSHPGYCVSLNNLANLYHNMGLCKKAEALYIESNSIYKKALGSETSDYAAALSNLASLYKTMGKYGEAEALYLQAKDIMQRSLNAYHPRYDVILVALVALYQKMQLPEKSTAYMLESSKVKLTQIKRYFPSLSESEKELYFRTLKSDFEYFNSFGFLATDKAVKLNSELYNNQISTKALLFDAGNRIRSSILQSSDTSVVSLYNKWQIKREVLSKAYKMPAGERQKERLDIDQLESQINTLEKQLSVKSQLFSGATEDYTWKDIQRKLGKGECAIELIRFRKFGVEKIVIDSSDVLLPSYPVNNLTDTVYYVALVVKPSSTEPELILLKNGNLIEGGYFKRYKNNIQFKLEDEASYGAFWKPIAEVLKRDKIKKVFLSPDGIYNSINLNTLLNPDTKKYLSEELSIQLVTNTKDVIALKKAGKAGKIKSASLFGYPEYGTDSLRVDELKKDRALSLQQALKDTTQRMFSSGKITALPGTKTEVAAVAKILTGYQVNVNQYLDRQATENEIKLLKNPQVLHIATHGFFTGDEGKIPGVVENAKTSRNPLFRSGLLFTNAQQTLDGYYQNGAEDGILTGYEAMGLSLNETDLVVLSACETGLGEIRNGEGVYGLQRAFQTAGAKSVLMSLWKVDDTATQQLMTAFYSNWLKSGDKRKAFNDAQETIRAKYKHPYYWGAFVLVGE